MRRLILAIAGVFTSVVVHAQQPLPPTLEFPTQDVLKLRAAIGQLPHDQVAAFTDMLDACGLIQLPSANDHPITDRGQCPTVTQSRQARDAALAAARSDGEKAGRAAQKIEDEKAVPAKEPK